VEHNCVSLRGVPGIREEFAEVVLDPVDDEFYAENMFLNFGEVGDNVTRLVDNFKKTSQFHQNVDNAEELLKFAENFPEFRKNSHIVSKHVTLMGELSRRVNQDMLFDVSRCEQDLACRDSEADHRKQVFELLGNEKVSQKDKLRLVLLYALRYEKSFNQGTRQMREMLYKAGLGSDKVALIDAVFRLAGEDKRSGDVFNNKTFYAKAKSTVRRRIGGVENVYTQHEPLLAQTLSKLFNQELEEVEFPTINGDSNTDELGFPPREVIVFVVGGITYEEVKCVELINGNAASQVGSTIHDGSSTAAAMQVAKQHGAKVVLGGSSLLNSESFLNEMARRTSSLPH